MAVDDMPGNCVVRRINDEPYIDQADEHIEVAQALLDEAGDSSFMEFDGDILTLKASNRTVCYRVAPFNASPNAIYGLRAARLIPA